MSKEYLGWRAEKMFSEEYRYAIYSNPLGVIARFPVEADRDLVLSIIGGHEEMRLAIGALLGDPRCIETTASGTEYLLDTEASRAAIAQLRAALTRANAIGAPECLEDD